MFIKLPESAGKTPLPPVPVLAAKSGNESIGKTLFADKATCAKCHKVKGQGKEVGPDLSEIGSKLSKSAMYVAILDPSAAITHNYQSYLIELDNGLVETGLLVNQTDESLTIKSAQGILKSFALTEVEAIEPSPVSLMPADLQKLLTADELIDVVEYLTTLKSGSQPAAEPSHLETGVSGNEP